MTEGDGAATTSSEPWISWLDIVIIVVFLIGAFVWWRRRQAANRKTASTFEFTPLMPMNGSLRTESDVNFVAKMKKTGRNVVAFFGSQTGTAEDLSQRLAKDANRYGMKGISLDPEECDMESLPNLKEIDNSLAIFCMATYGEGDPTDNAQEFHEFLQRGDTDLTGLNYVVFGLGNKTYEHYNAMGKFTDKRLAEMGASRVYEQGMGDDDGNLEEDFMLWREGFWPAVCDFFNIQTVGEDISTRQYTLTLHDLNEIDPEKLFTGEIGRLKSFEKQRPPYDVKNPFLAAVAVNQELHTGGERSCRHIEFDLGVSKIKYDAGDHLGIYPQNDCELIERLGHLLAVDLDQVITLTNVDEDSSKKHPFPCPCSYRVALLHYVDICSPPRTHVLKEISEYCKDEQEKLFLKSMSSASEDSRKKYHEWVLLARRNIVNILDDVPSCRPPLDHLLELLPRLQPRYYSISSSPRNKPGIVSVTAVVLQYKSVTNRIVKGVATNWLAARMPVGVDMQPKVPLFVRRSQLRLPRDSKLPIIMVGPGTGLAPFMGFMQEREQQIKEGKEVGPTILYFGCRRKQEDYIYREVLERWVKEGVLKELHLAFSREHPEKKIYVQMLLKQNAQQTWALLEKGAHIYVCGDARHMARDVHDTVKTIIESEGGKSEADAAKFVQRMEAQKRYQADVWF